MTQADTPAATPTTSDGAAAGADVPPTLGGELLPPWAADLLSTLTSSPAWKFLVVFAFVVLGFVASRYVVRLVGRPVAKRFHRQSVTQTVLRAVRLAVVFFAFLIGASFVGLGLGDVVLSVTVFSAVLGIILAPIVGSLISGLFVLADQPYEIGDMVELDGGARGFVDDITIRYTKVFTLDNTFLVIPNGNIREQQVTNLSAEDERTRLSLSILVTYESDVDLACDLVERAAVGCEDVIEGGPDIRIGAARYPAGPTCYVDEFADDGILLTLRYWVARPYKLLTMRSRVQSRVWDLLLEEPDVEVAYPHRELLFHDSVGDDVAGDWAETAGGDDADPTAVGDAGGDDSRHEEDDSRHAEDDSRHEEDVVGDEEDDAGDEE